MHDFAVFFIKVKKNVFYVFYLQGNVFNIYGLKLSISATVRDRGLVTMDQLKKRPIMGHVTDAVL